MHDKVHPKESGGAFAGVLLLLSLMRRESITTLGWALSLLASAAATLMLPVSLKHLVDTAPEAGSLISSFAPLVICAAALAFTTACRVYMLSVTGNRLVARLRSSAFATMLDRSMSFHDSTQSSVLLATLTSDTETIRSMLGTLSVGLRALITFSGALVMIILTSPKLAGIAALSIVAASIPIVARSRHLRKVSKEAHGLSNDATNLASDAITSVRLVKEFVRAGFEAEKYSRALETATRTMQRHAVVQAALSAGAIAMVLGAVILVLGFGTNDVFNHNVSPGQLGQFMLLALVAGTSATELLEVWGSVQRYAGSVSRVLKICPPTASSGPVQGVSPGCPSAPLSVHFEQVRFSYSGSEEHATLDDITFSAVPGERVALVGASGAGKSTILSLLMRFYEVDSGRIVIGSMDVRDLDPKHLRQMISVVAQRPTVLNGSAMDNIRCGRLDATDDEVMASAIDADADEFIRALPRGYDEPLGEHGSFLSGGQQQRISIARAFLKNAPILVLDEATSSLDAQSESSVHGALRRLMKGRTTIIVSHRFSTIVDADRIIVLSKGTIEDVGSHAELVQRSGTYSTLLERQMHRRSAERSVEGSI